MHGYKEASPSNADSKVSKGYQRHVKMVIFMIGLHLANNQLGHIKDCKGSAKA